MFIADPWTDYAAIYDDRYYDGAGCRPQRRLPLRAREPRGTVRAYEWRGLARVVQALVGLSPQTRWLDYGAGNGGLVRHLREAHGAQAVGYDQGAIVADAQALGIPFVDDDELQAHDGTYDVVTAIEVLEHLADPVADLRRMRRALRPGGLLLVTTGNLEPYRDRFTTWRYVIPEIHISFFEPLTLERAMTLARLRPQRLGRPPGFNDILKFKVLKNLGVRRRSRLTDAIPSTPLALAGDRIARVSDLRIGWAPDRAARTAPGRPSSR